MKLRAGLSLVLLSSLLLLATLAYASPPDPSWISGLYDDADFDSIIGLITSDAGVVEALGVSGPGPTAVVVIIVGSDQEPLPGPSPSSDAIRAPPAS
jgi:hypothetical protein